MEELESEDSFVDICQHNVIVVDEVAKELKIFLKNAKVPKPFGSVKSWLKAYISHFDGTSKVMLFSPPLVCGPVIVCGEF